MKQKIESEQNPNQKINTKKVKKNHETKLEETSKTGGKRKKTKNNKEIPLIGPAHCVPRFRREHIAPAMSGS
jgi:hypothetical protein